MITPFARLAAAIVLTATATLATACTAAPAAEPEVTETAAATPGATAPAPEPSAEPTEAVPIEDPTCETLISDQIVADFESVGWTARADPFYLGDREIPEGLQCMWADFAGQAGDHVQIFGWAPITADDAADAQDDLVSQGWVREDGDEGVYITQDPEMTIAPDAEGYGMTYLFGDGWVIVADTKQGLILVEWPPAA
jgi:hypothetical protein